MGIQIWTQFHLKNSSLPGLILHREKSLRCWNFPDIMDVGCFSCHEFHKKEVHFVT